MNLQTLLKNIETLSIQGSADREIVLVTQDSRKVVKGGLYIAIKGHDFDGHTFIDSAVEKGAVAVICNTLPTNLQTGITYVQVLDTKKIIGAVADAFYDNPSQKLKLIGVTGTNGKTTTATLLYEVLENAGYKCGLLSTVENKIHTCTIPATRTTPDPITLRELLSQMVTVGCTHCAMEVSSHALHQGRVDGLTFAAGIFTNLTQDHLDYHTTMENYLAEKKKFFDMLPQQAFAIVNDDDNSSPEMVATTKAKVIPFSLKSTTIAQSDIFGTFIVYNNEEYFIPLPGQYNISNALGVIIAVRALGLSKEQTQTGLKNAKGPRGRFEVVKNTKGSIGVVDYAHTPDGVEKILEAISKIKTADQKLITVVGCGGNRDTGKRPKMLAAALQYSDIVIGTSDNPRNEDPQKILEEMEKALTPESIQKYTRVTDRKEAIIEAVRRAEVNDIVAILGKGHEDYQEIKGVRHLFSDGLVFLKAAASC